MSKPKSTARNSKNSKSNARSLRVRTKVRAGRIIGNRCEALRRKV